MEAEVSNDMFIVQVLNKNTSLLNSQFPILDNTSLSFSLLSESFIFTDSTISSVFTVIFVTSPTINQVSGSTVTSIQAAGAGVVVKYIFSDDHSVDQSMSRTSIFIQWVHMLTSFIT
jgi:hypothetical protein